MMNESFYAVCKLGPSRFFWAAWASYDTLCAREVLGSGYTATREMAEQQAQTAVGPLGSDYGHAGFAKGYHRYLAAQRRTARLAGKPQRTADAAPTEYLYTTWLSDYDNEHYWSAHRIVKRTAKKVFILDRELSAEHLARYPEDLRTIALDRQRLEQEGYATNSNTCCYYYTETAMREREAREHAYHPPCLAILGLSRDCTLRDVHVAYRRKAREMHPDNGGSHQGFLDLRTAYEVALHMVRGAL